MIRPYLRKIILVTFGVVLSLLLSMLAPVLVNSGDPGAYVVHYLFPQGTAHKYSFNTVLNVYFGTNFVVSFAVLAGLYLLVTMLFRRSKSDRS